MVYKGKGSYVYTKPEGATFGFGAAVIGAAGHVPINPIVNMQELPESRYRERVERTIDSVVPKIVFTELMEIGETTINTIFRDPFQMAYALNYKTVENPWTGTNDLITMDFSAETHRESFMIHSHIDDPTNPIDLTFYGCQIPEYRWRIETGNVVREIYRVTSINNKEDVQAMVCANGFHDQSWGSGVGGWSYWDTGAPYHSKDVTITIGGAITSIKAKAASIGFTFPKKTEHDMSSMIANAINYDQERTHFFELEGVALTDADWVEIRKLYSAKTKATVKVAIGDANRYMQFTNGYLVNIDKISMPPVTRALEPVLRWEGGVDSVLSASLQYSLATDPDPMITN